MRFLATFFTIFTMVILVTAIATETFDAGNYRQSGSTCDGTIYYDAEVQKIAGFVCARLKKHGVSRVFHRYPRGFKPPKSFGIPVQRYVQFPLPPKIKRGKKKFGFNRQTNQAYLLMRPENCQSVAVMMFYERKPKICLWSKFDSNGIDAVVD